jgi:hypothetical protein
MADNKYGRIFTEEDLRNVVANAIDEKIDGEDGLDQIIVRMYDNGEFKFPKDEPLFMLRAQDQLAVQAISDYSSMSAANGVNQDQQHAVQQALDQFKVWQRVHSDRVKLPD